MIELIDNSKSENESENESTPNPMERHISFI